MSPKIKRLRQFFVELTPEQRAAQKSGRPFFIIITVILGIVGLVVLNNSPQLQTPLRRSAFIGLMVIHIGLHWLSGLSAEKVKFSLIYLTTQLVLGFGVVLISDMPELALSVFATLIGETIGVFGITRYSTIFLIGYILMTPLSYLVVGDLETLQGWMPPTISTFSILIAIMVLFRRQSETSDRARQLAIELETANQQLTEYAHQVERLTLNAERQRMARELHDTLAQGVAGMVLQLEAAKQHHSAERFERVGEIIAQSLARARSTLADSRAAIDDLRAVPDSFVAAVQTKIERFTQATGIPCELELALGDYDPAPKVSAHLRRLLSEALANITRHAQADQTWVRLVVAEEQLRLEIRDNGQGFDLEVATRSGHYGLLGMRERTRLVGGTIQIDSQIGVGTHIKITIPLKILAKPTGETS
jgi:two-component system, NarL family, sensor histidine kinase YdfH